MPAKNAKTSKSNIWIIASILTILTLALVMVCYKVNYSKHASEQPIMAENWTKLRADIEDRNGIKLAQNVISGHIMFRQKALEDMDAVAHKIHEVLPYQYSLEQAYDIVKNKKFMYLKRYATDTEREQIKKSKLGGLEVEAEQMRRYPQHNLFAHVVGFVDYTNNNGIEGVEEIFNSYLQENTESLRLSLDSNIQKIFHTNLDKAMKNYRAKSAMGLLMNAKNGEMLAIVSLPDYDPENIMVSEENPVENRKFGPLSTILRFGDIFKIFYIAQEQPNFFHKLHFDKKLTLDFGKTEYPVMPQECLNISMDSSFECGIAVTPIHLLAAINSITNGGLYVLPTIQIQNTDSIYKKHRVVSEEYSAQIRANMLKISNDINIKAKSIAGIVETVEKHDNTANKQGYIATFIATFPTEQPQYTMMIILDEPYVDNKKSNHNVTSTADKILNQIIPVLNKEQQKGQ